jgi:hypothetical protein
MGQTAISCTNRRQASPEARPHQLTQSQHVLARLLLTVQGKRVEEHGDVDHIPRSSRFRQIIGISKDVCRYEVRGVEMVLVSEQRLSSCLKGREQICTMQTRERSPITCERAKILPKTGAEVEEYERCACCAVLQASHDSVVVRVSQDALLDEPELADTWPREDLPGLLALSFELAANHPRLTTTHDVIAVWDYVRGRYSTTLSKQLPKRRCELMLKTLGIPGHLP